MVEIDIGLVTAIVTIIISVVSSVLGVQVVKAKDKAKKFKLLLDTVIDAWEDDKITEEEGQAIVDAAKALIAEEKAE
jgi:hypothetical protein